MTKLIPLTQFSDKKVFFFNPDKIINIRDSNTGGKSIVVFERGSTNVEFFAEESKEEINNMI